MVAQGIALLPWLVWILPIVGALLTPLLAKIGSRPRNYAAVAFSLLSALSAALLLPTALQGLEIHDTVSWIPSLNIEAGVLADPLSVLMANVVGWISFLIMVYSLGYMKNEGDLTRYWFFMNFFIGNMQLIVLSDNFLQLFFGWEGVGLCSYALIGFWHSDEKKYWVGTPGHRALGLEQAYSPTHAGMKAFITTRIGDVLFLIGILVLYGASGTFSFKALGEEYGWAAELARTGLLVPVAVLIFGGAVGKSAQFPLHEWLPDAMAGPTAVSALIHAATMVKAGVFLVARTGPLFYQAALATEQIAPLFSTIALIGAFTAFLAATQAMVSREVKKVLAYSTVSQIGYMMLALGGAGLAADFVSGYTAGFFHLMSHAIFKATLFMGAGALLHASRTKYMDEMGGLRGNMRFTFLAMLIGAASLSGVPPLSGFWSKDAVLASILSIEDSSLAMVLYVLASVTALITAFYSFRMIGMIFFGKKSGHLEHLEHEGHDVHEAPKVMWVPYMILALATVAIGLSGPFFEGWLRGSLGTYLHELYPRITEEAEAGLNITAVSTSLFAVVVGGLAASQLYITRRVDPARLVSSSRMLMGLQKFLVNRWYMNAIFYHVFVNGSMKVSRGLFRGLELSVIDRISDTSAVASMAFSSASGFFDKYFVDGFVDGVGGAGTVVSRAVRRVQTGITEEYVFAFALGVLALALLMIFLI